MRNLRLILLVVLLALGVLAKPVRERVRKMPRDPCRYRPGCFSVISGVEVDDKLEFATLPDLSIFPTLAPAIQDLRWEIRTED